MPTTIQGRAGLALALAAALTWGLMPAYFEVLGAVSPLEILAHRVLWSAVLILVLLPLFGQGPALRTVLADRRALAMLMLSSLLIAINWLVYVMSVTSGHILESSLGYYIMPLVNVGLGRLFLGERLSRGQKLACLIAALSVAGFAWAAGGGVWRALILAVTFGAYGLVRKLVRAEALTGMAVECCVLAPLAFGWLAHCRSDGSLHLHAATPGLSLMLIGTGVITTLPLLSYAAAARRLTLSALGLIMYLNPTLQFALGVAVYGEPFDIRRLFAFLGIWLALALYTAEAARLSRAVSPLPG